MNELIIRKRRFLRNLFSLFILLFSWFLFLSLLIFMFFSLGGYYSDSINAVFLLIDFPLIQVKETFHAIFAILSIFTLPTLLGIVMLTTNGEEE
ncbi:hypothetical protein HRD83_13135 [Enterococcus faecalis]|nr:hypothetical protein [Enterococcus faecalis]NSN09596.1 hypothetical protein [Enterococcus faecalis]NSU70499.1 hypothetical protein [Enterococcus faecalis]